MAADTRTCSPPPGRIGEEADQRPGCAAHGRATPARAGCPTGTADVRYRSSCAGTADPLMLCVCSVTDGDPTDSHTRWPLTPRRSLPHGLCLRPESCNPAYKASREARGLPSVWMGCLPFRRLRNERGCPYVRARGVPSSPRPAVALEPGCARRFGSRNHHRGRIVRRDMQRMGKLRSYALIPEQCTAPSYVPRPTNTPWEPSATQDSAVALHCPSTASTSRGRRWLLAETAGGPHPLL